MHRQFIRFTLVAVSTLAVSSCHWFTSDDEEPEQHDLSVSIIGAGAGAISTSPAGVACSYSGGATSGQCSAGFADRTAVTLTAAPSSGHTFAGWSGDCTGTAICQLTMDRTRSVTAAFTAPPPAYLLTVVGVGTGTGSVTASAGGVACTVSAGSASGTCSALYTSGAVVTLAAVPATGHTFTGWSGACTGTGTCQVTMTQARSVAVTFTAPLPAYPFTVTAGGTGNGSVTSSPAGISCTASAGGAAGICTTSYTSGTVVTLSAAPAIGHTFAGWTGACTGTGTCQVTMSQAQSVAAAFMAPAPTFALAVTAGGTGSGSVTSSPAGINCTATAGNASGACTASYAANTAVTLTAAPVTGHTFAGWSGACTGTGACQVTMSQARSVAAAFTTTFALAVTAGGTGNGSVTSSPVGISCAASAGSRSGTCGASYAPGTVVTLTASPISGHTFAGWSGACSGTASCQVTMSQARTVTAAFNIGQQIAVPAYFFNWSVLLPYIPTVKVILLNPNNGPGAGYTTQIRDAKARGAEVYGYVYTKYANTQPNPLSGGARDRTIAAVQADIDRYYSLYSNLDGIFLDEVTGGSDCANARSYYLPIYQYAQRTHPGAKVIINPGTSVDRCYLDVADIVVTFEDSFASYQNAWSPSGRDWETSANSPRIWHIVHTANSTQWQTAVNLSRTRNAGYVYVTHLSSAPDVNTFGSLPPYFDAEVDNVRPHAPSR